MNRPALPSNAPQAFVKLFEDAAQELAIQRATIDYALRTGVCPETLLDYVRGAPGRRAEARTMVVNSEWALKTVAGLVKAKRRPNSFASKLLASDNSDPYHWGMKSSGDRDMDLAYLLECACRDVDPST